MRDYNHAELDCIAKAIVGKIHGQYGHEKDIPAAANLIKLVHDAECDCEVPLTAEEVNEYVEAISIHDSVVTTIEINQRQHQKPERQSR